MQSEIHESCAGLEDGLLCAACKCLLCCLACSYLGYGLMAGRAKVIQAHADHSHPCFSKGAALSYTYGGKEYSVGEVVEAGDFKRCAAVTLKALEHDKDCGQPKVGQLR